MNKNSLDKYKGILKNAYFLLKPKTFRENLNINEKNREVNRNVSEAIMKDLRKYNCNKFKKR